MRRNLFLFIIVSVLTAFFTGHFAFAQTEPESDEVLLRRAQLNAELLRIEQEIEKERVFLNEKQRESVSLERDITILDADIKKAKLGIRARTITIDGLLEDIGEKGEFIEVLDEKVEREKQSLSQLLRKTNEIDSTSFVEIILGNKDLSDFFIDVDSFESIKQALDASFKEIRSVKNATESEKKELEEKKLDEVDLKKLQELEKKKIENSEAKKQRILTTTKGEEAEYQKIIKAKEKSAAEIRAALFELRGTKAIPFGQALIYANDAHDRTGVRPAFLLGVIAEESNLGENVGSGNWIDDMHPDRDKELFGVIAATLGLDPDTLPVSKKPWYGWGGAMGPAQFIPTTWAFYGGYKKEDGVWRYVQSKDKIRSMLGKSSPSNPWEPRDAFTASAVLLRDNGAAKGGYAAERLAALRYLAGWKNAEKSAYAFYGDDVMGLAAKYQGLINILEAE